MVSPTQLVPEVLAVWGSDLKEGIACRRYAIMVAPLAATASARCHRDFGFRWRFWDDFGDFRWQFWISVAILGSFCYFSVAILGKLLIFAV